MDGQKKMDEQVRMVKVKAIPTEVYSRVVGYYRPVQNWNKGKVEEFSGRSTIDPDRAPKL